MNGALLQGEEENDYIFPEDSEHGSIWVTVNNISVYIRRTDEGVVVDLFPHYRETEDPIASTYAWFAEAEPEEEEINAQ